MSRFTGKEDAASQKTDPTVAANAAAHLTTRSLYTTDEQTPSRLSLHRPTDGTSTREGEGRGNKAQRLAVDYPDQYLTSTAPQPC